MLLEETVAKLIKKVELLKSHRCEAAPSLSTSSTPQRWCYYNMLILLWPPPCYYYYYQVKPPPWSWFNSMPYLHLLAKADTGSQNHCTLSADRILLPLLPDINQMWSFIKSIITNACNLFIPKVKFQSCQSPKCFNAKIRHHLHGVHSQWRLTNPDSTNYWHWNLGFHN